MTIRSFILVVAALALVPASVSGQGTTRSRRVEEQPAAAVRTPKADAAAAEAALPTVPVFETLPFGPGETLTYDIAWNSSTTAATMVMTVGDKAADGMPIRVDVETVGLTRFLAAVDAEYTTYCSPKTILGNRTEFETSVNGKSQRGSTVFDRKKNVAVSSQATTPIGAETSDGLSLFYRLRALPLKNGEVLTLDGVEGRERRQVRAIVEARESIASTNGSLPSIRVAFMPIVGGQPDDRNRIRVWYSDDVARVPLLITAEPDLGTIRVTLRSARATRTK